VSLLFDYSCQSMLLEAAAGSPSHLGPLTLGALAAPLPPPQPGQLLTGLVWELTPVLTVLWNNVSSGSSSARGWQIADSALSKAPPLAASAAGPAQPLLPGAASLKVTIALPLSSTYSATLLTQRVPVTQLLANLVGLTGMLAFFGTAFGSFEEGCGARGRGRGGAECKVGELEEVAAVQGSVAALQSNPLHSSRLMMSKRASVAQLLNRGAARDT
jgi:hypothetical protein